MNQKVLVLERKLEVSYGLVLNWYLNENLKWVLNYDRTEFDGGAAGGADRADEGIFLARFALGF